MTVFPEALKNVLAGNTLECDRARRAMGCIVDGGVALSQAGAFLGALSLRGATCDEIVGFAQALRERCVKVSVDRAPLLDACGSGASGMLNISTAVAFIAAGAGAFVAKQVSRPVLDRCGSADVLEALGVRVELDALKAGRCVEEAGLGFFHSAVFHPALKNALTVRQELGVRTVFDLLEPLANPAGARCQLLGVYSTALVPVLIRALKTLGSESAMVVSSRDGFGGFSLAAPTVVAQLHGGRIEEYEVDPAALGLARREAVDFSGGDAETNARVILSVLNGERGPAFDAALLNAAAAVIVAGKAEDFKEGLARAAESVDGCRALEALNSVKKISQG